MTTTIDDRVARFEQDAAALHQRLLQARQAADDADRDYLEASFAESPDARQLTKLLAERTAKWQELVGLERALDSIDSLRQQATSTGAGIAFDQATAARRDIAGKAKTIVAEQRALVGKLADSARRLRDLDDDDSALKSVQIAANGSGGLGRQIPSSLVGVGLFVDTDVLERDLRTSEATLEQAIRDRRAES